MTMSNNGRYWDDAAAASLSVSTGEEEIWEHASFLLWRRVQKNGHHWACDENTWLSWLGVLLTKRYADDPPR